MSALDFIKRREVPSCAQVQIDKTFILRNVEGNRGERIDNLLKRRRAHRAGIVANLDRYINDTSYNSDAAHGSTEFGKFL